jgi:hypothetical protein
MLMPFSGRYSGTVPQSLSVSDGTICLALVIDLLNQPAVPHASVDDDIYAGFHIPKGEQLQVLSYDQTRFNRCR